MTWGIFFTLWALGCPLTALAFTRLLGWSEASDSRNRPEGHGANDNRAPMEAVHG